jgi:hypothetical protein
MINLKQFINNHKATLLGLGPMSENSIRAVVQIANQAEIPTQMIASRRQIDCKNNGGGYVGSFCTETFIPFVRGLDKKQMIMISRDHGGPWQNYAEIKNKLSLAEAMDSAKASFANDISLGMDAIHIDPSFDPNGATKKQINDRILELYEFCLDTSAKVGKKPIIEIGCEQQIEGFEDHLEFNDFILTILNKLQAKNYPLPDFVVLQTGTKVMGCTNYGELPSLIKKKEGLKSHKGIISLSNCVRRCDELGIMSKSHNGDYLDEETLRFFPQCGISAINIAPELGFIETSFILNALQASKMYDEYDVLVSFIIEEKKWLKWIHPNYQISDLDKVKISGHYLFENPFFKEIKRKLENVYLARGTDLNEEIIKDLKIRMVSLYKALNWKINL